MRDSLCVAVTGDPQTGTGSAAQPDPVADQEFQPIRILIKLRRKEQKQFKAGHKGFTLSRSCPPETLSTLKDREG